MNGENMTLVEYPPLGLYQKRYEVLQMTPLRVAFRLRPGSCLAGYDPLNLDNLLARCVVDEATGWQGLPASEEPYDLPVPLKYLWRSETGLPLWAATPFYPQGVTFTDFHFWHKRAQPGTLTGTKSGKFSITSTKGRWMDRRVPLPTQSAEWWEATCIGNETEITRLLNQLSFIGKRRASGFGEVERWEVEPLDAFTLVRDNRLTRPLPAIAFDSRIELLPGGMIPEGTASPVGWTPPQWKPSLFAPGWWAGTPLVRVIDFFEAALHG